MAEKLPLIMLAGRDKDKSDELLEYANVEYKALIKIKGKALITIVLESFFESDIISHYFIIGLPKELVELPDGLLKESITFLDYEGDFHSKLNFVSNHILELAKDNPSIFPDGKPYAFQTTSDLPFIRGDIISQFYNSSKELEADLHVAIIEQKVMESKYGDTKRTYFKLKEGNYCVGDMTIINLTCVNTAIDQVKIARNNRKKVIWIVLKFKPSIIFKYLLKRITIVDVQEIVSKVFYISSTKLIVTEDPEIAMDIDYPFQLDIVRDVVKND